MTNATSRLTIATDGDVGIGTSSPANALKLDVEGKVGASAYCDSDGMNCTTPGSAGSKPKRKIYPAWFNNTRPLGVHDVCMLDSVGIHGSAAEGTLYYCTLSVDSTTGEYSLSASHANLYSLSCRAVCLDW